MGFTKEALAKILLGGVFLLGVAGFSSAKEYPKFDSSKLVSSSETKQGKTFSVNMEQADAIIAAIAQHAGSYPAKFDSPKDKERATADYQNVSRALTAAVSNSTPDIALLLRLGLVNSFGYNLDVSGAGQKASDAFARLISIDPKHAQGNFYYGIFLAGANQPKEAVPFLEKARSLGLVEADRVLGMTLLNLGQRPQAITRLEAYVKAVPNDAATAQLLAKEKAAK